jgi:hypothetical protein
MHDTLLFPGAHYSLHYPPVGHCEEPLARKQSQTNNEIATPFGLAMTISGKSEYKLFHAPLNIFHYTLFFK